MSSADPDIMAFLLMVLLSMSVILGTFLVCFANYWLRQKRKTDSAMLHPIDEHDEEENSPTEAVSVFLIERPSRWVAIKSSNLSRVQSAIGLHNPVPCSWSEAFAHRHEQHLFISPPVQGWILLFGQALPDPNDDVDECFCFILRLSRELGHVQFFSSNPAVSHHAWVKAENNKIIRAYAWAGRTLWNQGKITFAEQALGVRCYEYGDQPDATSWRGDGQAGNAEKVVLLAARWSIDPLSLNHRQLKNRLGITGGLARQDLRG